MISWSEMPLPSLLICCQTVDRSWGMFTVGPLLPPPLGLLPERGMCIVVGPDWLGL